MKKNPFGTQSLHQIIRNACQVNTNTTPHEPHLDYPKQLIDAVSRGIWLGFMRDITLNMNHQPSPNTHL